MGKKLSLRREPARVTGESPCLMCAVFANCGSGMCKEWQNWFSEEWDLMCKILRDKWGAEKDADE